MLTCDQGHDGKCCCNCVCQIELTCHPVNKTIAKGPTTQLFAYACVQQTSHPLKPRVMVMEGRHGMCELHTYPSEMHLLPNKEDNP